MKHHNGLELDHDIAYHRRFWAAQRGAWICWALVMLAAFIGLAGPGFKGKKTVSDANAGLALTIERFVHSQAPTELEIRLAPMPENVSETQIAINRAFIEAIETRAIHPEPKAQKTSGQEIVYTFNRGKSKEPMTVVLRYETKTIGKIPIQIRLNNISAIFAEQFSFP